MTNRNDTIEILADARQALADLEVILDVPNPRLALHEGIEAIDYRLRIVYEHLL